MFCEGRRDALVCAVDGDVDDGVLVYISQIELIRYDELFTLESWSLVNYYERDWL
jgi:hypothetical protein